jgi:hypothetical protein
MDLREVGLEDMHWIDLAKVRESWRVMNAVMNLLVP